MQLNKYNRNYLKANLGKVITVTGTFDRYGRKLDKKDKNGAMWSTGIMKDIKDVKNKHLVIADHLWFTMVGVWLRKEIKKGSEISVTGTINFYTKSNNHISYGITNVTNVEIIREGNKFVPCKEWRYGKYKYYKFITDDGTKWFKAKDQYNIIRIVYKKEEDFIETEVNVDASDNKCLEYIKNDMI